MWIRLFYFLGLMLAALLLGASFAQTLQIPSKLRYEGAEWLRVQQTRHAGPDTIAVVIEAGAIVATGVLTFLLRGNRPAFLLALAGFLCLTVALFIWLMYVSSVNRQVPAWTAQSLPQDWSRLRLRWEYAHAARFALQAIAFGTLVGSFLLYFRERVPVVGESP